MAQPRSRLSVLLRHGAAAAFSASWIPPLIVVCGLSGRKHRGRVSPAMQRVWGRTMLAIAGVHLDVEPGLEARLDSRTARVVLFNHASTLDLLVGAALMPAGGVTVVKKEMAWVPFIGQACWAVGNIFVDRGDADRARASMQRAAERVRAETLQVVIAPEGTRSEKGSLGPFKLGAFHMARQARVPILPLVMHGCAEIWPRHTAAPKRGTVRVRALDEVDVSDVPPEELRAVADALRLRYEEALARGPG